MEPVFFAASLQFEAVNRAVYGPRVYEQTIGVVEVYFERGGMKMFANASEVEELDDPPRLRFMRPVIPSGQLKSPHVIPMEGIRYYVIR